MVDGAETESPSTGSPPPTPPPRPTNRDRIRDYLVAKPDATPTEIGRALVIDPGTVGKLLKKIKAAPKAAIPASTPAGSDPEAKDPPALARAARDVDALTAERTALEATDARRWDIEAGEYIRKSWWTGRGLADEFTTPEALVETALPWWFENRDRVALLEQTIADLRAEVGGLRAVIDPVNQARETWTSIRDTALVSSLLTNQPVGGDVLLALLKSAKEANLA